MHSPSRFDTQKIIAYLQTSSCVATTMRAARAAGFAADPTDEHVTTFARLLDAVGIEQLDEFDMVVDRNKAVLPKYFEQLYARTPKTWTVTANVPFLCELVLILEYAASLTVKALTDIGWPSEFAQIALDVTKSFPTATR